VPYELTLNAFYDVNDCPPVIVDPAHCVAEGVTGDDLAFPGDTVVSMASDWQVVTEGPITGRPSVFTATYGNGGIVVELGHPSPGALCPYSDAGFESMVTCCMEPGPTPIIESSWGKLKTSYR
jgi:hypothetical protein